MLLVFNPESLSRTMTRAQWRECWRWKRTVERQLREHIERETESFVIFGSSWPADMRARIIDGLVNPAVLLFPDEPRCESLSIEPGGVSYIGGRKQDGP